MKSVHVLITSSGSTTAISTAKSLRLSPRLKYKIIGTDINKLGELGGTGYFDKVYRISRYDNKRYLSDLMSVCKKEKIRCIIPINDREVEKLAKYNDLFTKRGITVIASGYQTVKTCNDKYLTWKRLGEEGIATPRVYLYDQLNLVKKEKMKKFFIKPRFGISSIDCYEADSIAQLFVLAKKIRKPVIQKFLQGEKYVVDLMRNSRTNECVTVIRKELNARSGIGVKAVTVKNNKIARYAEGLARALDITGPANIELFYKNKIQLIEINPRLSAGVILSSKAGINIPELAVQIFLGNKVTMTSNYRAGVFMARYWEESYYGLKK